MVGTFRKAFAQSRPEGTVGLVERELFRVPTPLSYGEEVSPYGDPREGGVGYAPPQERPHVRPPGPLALGIEPPGSPWLFQCEAWGGQNDARGEPSSRSGYTTDPRS